MTSILDVFLTLFRRLGEVARTTDTETGGGLPVSREIPSKKKLQVTKASRSEAIAIRLEVITTY